MKVFVSWLISGFQPFRIAPRSAITTLVQEPIMAEDFGALPNSPQLACLRELRESDAFALTEQLSDEAPSLQRVSCIVSTHRRSLMVGDAPS